MILVPCILVIKDFFVIIQKGNYHILSFKTATEDIETSEATEIIEGTRHEVKQMHKLLF